MRKKRYFLSRYTKKRRSRRGLRPSVKRKFRLFTFATFSVILSALILTCISIYKFVNAPFSSALYVDYVDTQRVWNQDETNLVLMLVDDINDKYSEVAALSIINFDASTSRYAIYHVPVDVEIEYALNYGNGPLSRIYAVGNTDQNRGVYLLRRTLLRLFAIKIDGYVIIDKNGFKVINNLVGPIDQEDLSATLRLRKIVKLPKVLRAFRSVTITNLKVADILDILQFVRGTSVTSSYVANLTKYHLLDPNKWDGLWQSKLSLSGVKKESIKVFIANASRDPKIPGLASWGGRVAQNIGADILEVQNSLVDFPENTIITDDPNLVTVKKLADALDISTIINVEDLNANLGYNPQIFRARVSLIVTNF